MTDKEMARKYLKDSSDYYDPREPLTERKMLQMCMDCIEIGYNKAKEEVKDKEIRTDNTETLKNALNRIAELEEKIDKIKNYLAYDIPHELMNEAVNKIWYMI